MKVKTILLILVISFFPLMISANGPIKCFQLKQDIEFDEVEYKEDLWVGEKGCVIGQNTDDPPGDITITTNCTGAVISPETGPTGCYTAKWGLISILDSTYTVINWIFFGLIAMVSLFTILGAFDILTAAGDPEKIKKGRERIMYAMIGLAVALLSRAIPGVVEALIG